MQLSVTEREQLYAILEKYDQNPKVQQMREFIQHGDVTTYQHCKNVVLVSCWLNHRLHLLLFQPLFRLSLLRCHYHHLSHSQQALKLP